MRSQRDAAVNAAPKVECAIVTYDDVLVHKSKRAEAEADLASRVVEGWNVQFCNVHGGSLSYTMLRTVQVAAEQPAGIAVR